MALGELLDQIREHYISKLTDEVKSYPDNEIIIEPAYLDSDGNIAKDGFFHTGSRVDLVHLLDGQVERAVNIDTENMLSFERIKFDWESNLSVVLCPFQWNYCSVRLIGESINWEPVQTWFSDWFEEKVVEGSLFHNCVHFLSDPELFENGQLFFVDFGTAPIDALESLLDSIQNTGVSNVEFGCV